MRICEFLVFWFVCVGGQGLMGGVERYLCRLGGCCFIWRGRIRALRR